MDDRQIVLHLFQAILEQQRNICDLARNDLLLIELAHGSASPEAFAVAASTVRSALYSVDALVKLFSPTRKLALVIFRGRAFCPARFFSPSRLAFIFPAFCVMCQMHNRALAQACAVCSPKSGSMRDIAILRQQYWCSWLNA